MRQSITLFALIGTLCCAGALANARTKPLKLEWSQANMGGGFLGPKKIVFGVSGSRPLLRELQLQLAEWSVRNNVRTKVRLGVLRRNRMTIKASDYERYAIESAVGGVKHAIETVNAAHGGGLDEAQVERVLKRAVELDSGRLLKAADVEAIGQEVGVSREAIRQALKESR
jgi:NACalpha-BTF3-like transcription factor